MNASPQIGYLRVGWSGNVYALQGIGSLTPANQISELGQAGIVPGQATAVGGLISAAWGFAPSWQLNLRAGGQVAFNPLSPTMQFTLGSDVGLRGLPDQLIGGDNGWLGTGEVVWTFWQRRPGPCSWCPSSATAASTAAHHGSASATPWARAACWLGGWLVRAGPWKPAG